MDVDGSAFQQRAADTLTPAWPKRDFAQIFRRASIDCLVGRSQPKTGVAREPDVRDVGLAQTRRLFGQRIEHGLQGELDRLMTLSTSAVAVCC